MTGSRKDADGKRLPPFHITHGTYDCAGKALRAGIALHVYLEPSP